MSLGQAPEKIAQEPVQVTAIDLVDLIPMPVVKVVEPELEPEDRRVMKITAYTKNDKGMDGLGITTSGERVQEGRTMAAGPSLPFGTEVYIPALDHTYTIVDRGGAIKGNRLDLYMEQYDDAMEFGVQDLEAVIKY